MSDELSESEGGDEAIDILVATRADTSPPRKRRKLNNNKSQSAECDSSTDASDSDREEKSNSDKENTYTINVNNNNRKRNRTQTQSKSSQRKPRPRNNSTYTFGDQRFKEALAVNPGAIVRLELVNFLCHSNFSISFHPNVNIIYGQNGSGKSAVEAGISMALGQKSKKTGRGNNVKDVIKDGTDFARIRLFLHNQGPERLIEYPTKEIVIERKLTASGKNGNSYFKILDGVTLKTKATGIKAVRAIADRFNLNVNNPCVVLKQSVAKEFLNSTNNHDKYKFFMQASKLGNYAVALEQAKANVNESIQRQQQTKNGFQAIQDNYYEAKQKLDTLVSIEQQKEKILYWERAEKYMKYNEEKVCLDEWKEKISEIEEKITSGNTQLQDKRTRLTNDIDIAKQLKAEIEAAADDVDKYLQPMNQLKGKINVCERQRKQSAATVSVKQKWIDKAHRKINGFKQQYNNAMQELQNNERGQKLAQIQNDLNEYTQKLAQYRTDREPLVHKVEKTIEMKENEQKLQQRRNDVFHKQEEMNQLQRALRELNQQNNNNQSERFLHPSLKRRGNNNNNRSYRNNRNEISVYAIRQCIQRHRRKFTRPPIGPLGEYVQMIDKKDQNANNRNIQIVQTVLGGSLYVFLVANSKDMATFRKIMSDTFHKTVPCIQYAYSDQMEHIHANAFTNMQDIIRVSDMFTIKDNNAWVYNAIITNSSPERVYAYGDLASAKDFLQHLNSNKSRCIDSVMTYREANGLYKVSKRGDTVSGTPQRRSDPVLQTDNEQAKQWYQHELNLKMQEKHDIDVEINELNRFVQNNNTQVREYERQLRNYDKNIKILGNKIERLQGEQRDLNEEEEDNNELQDAITELQNSIEDEKSQIAQYEVEIQPFKQREEELLQELTVLKRESHNMEQKIKEEQYRMNLKQNKYKELTIKLSNDSQRIATIPKLVSKLNRELQQYNEEYESDKERINNLLLAAQALGDAISEENYPRNPKRRKRIFTISELRAERLALTAEIRAWENEPGNNDAEQIRKKYEAIQPKYISHQERVTNCNNNCDEMHRMLVNRRKNFAQMKLSVRDGLSLEFRYIMKQQGHDGWLEIDYDTPGTLDMFVNMASHDNTTQVRNTKTLSGGERSYAQVALIMALQKFSGSPMCIYDEFDVFMDSVNRSNSIKILLDAALGKDNNKNNNNNEKNKNRNKNNNNKNSENGQAATSERQYIFITPNDVSPIIAEGHNANQIRIHQLKPPRRS